MSKEMINNILSKVRETPDPNISIIKVNGRFCVRYWGAATLIFMENCSDVNVDKVIDTFEEVATLDVIPHFLTKAVDTTYEAACAYLEWKGEMDLSFFRENAKKYIKAVGTKEKLILECVISLIFVGKTDNNDGVYDEETQTINSSMVDMVITSFAPFVSVDEKMIPVSKFLETIETTNSLINKFTKGAK